MNLQIEPNMMKCKTQRERSKRSKLVRFSEYSSLSIIDPNTSEDKGNSWYTKTEIDIFKQNARQTSKALWKTKTAKAMKHIAKSAANNTPQANITIHSKDAIRGLEHLIAPEVSMLLMAKRRKTIARVLKVQKMQKMAGTCIDPFITARVSEMNSAFSKEWCSRITDLQYA